MHSDDFDKISVLLIAAALVVGLYNTTQIGQLQSGMAGLESKDTSLQDDVIPKGVPTIYGEKLKISFDDISADNPQVADATIRKLGDLDRAMELEGETLKRYIKITTSISCEYCCGADAITFSNGQPACGCAHSYAMRGLAKYLVTNHADEYTDEQILEELGKWKTLFFPSQIGQKAQVLSEKGIELTYINLASNKYRGVEKGVSGEMVGGC